MKMFSVTGKLGTYLDRNYSLLDEIAGEISQLSDAEIAEAAAKIQAQKDRAKAAMTPERAQKMKDREKKRRLLNAEILKLAKAKGLVPGAAAPAAEGEGAAAEGTQA